MRTHKPVSKTHPHKNICRVCARRRRHPHHPHHGDGCVPANLFHRSNVNDTAPTHPCRANTARVEINQLITCDRFKKKDGPLYGHPTFNSQPIEVGSSKEVHEKRPLARRSTRASTHPLRLSTNEMKTFSPYLRAHDVNYFRYPTKAKKRKRRKPNCTHIARWI
jgi:hypothetical protein